MKLKYKIVGSKAVHAFLPSGRAIMPRIGKPIIFLPPNIAPPIIFTAKNGSKSHYFLLLPLLLVLVALQFQICSEFSVNLLKPRKGLVSELQLVS